MKTLLYIFKVLLLGAPTAIEVIDDRRSDPNKRMDVVTRGAYIGIFSFIDAILSHVFMNQGLWTQWCKAAFLSFAVFFFAFDYIMGLVYGRVLGYLGTTSVWDNAVASVHPWILFAIRLAVLVGASLIYIL